MRSIELKVITLFLMLFLVGCTSTGKLAVNANKVPSIIPLYDDNWVLSEPVTVTISTRSPSPKKSESFVIPKGFISDLSTIPVPFNLFLNKTGRYATAGIIHDYLYWEQLCSDRSIADIILVEALKTSDNVEEDKKKYDGLQEEWRNARRSIARKMFYGAVHLFGWSAWNKNAESKGNGNWRYVKPHDLNKIVPGVRKRDLQKEDISPVIGKDEHTFCSFVSKQKDSAKQVVTNQSNR